MSLRAWLLAGVLIMTAVGLLAAGGGTYLALRSFLLDRVDQQWMATRASVGRGLRQSNTGTIDTTTLDQVAPPIAFVEVRDGAGKVVAEHTPSSLSGLSPAPRLPAALHPPPASRVGGPSRGRAPQFDVGALSGGGRYRVLVSSLPAPGGVLVVAVSLNDVYATLRRLLHVELLIAGGLLGLLALTTFWLLRRGLRPSGADLRGRRRDRPGRPGRAGLPGGGPRRDRTARARAQRDARTARGGVCSPGSVGGAIATVRVQRVA